MSTPPTKAQFAAIAQFVNFAYDISAGSTPGGPLPLLPPGFPTDYSLVAFVQAVDDFWGYQFPAYYGFVAYSAAKKHVVVAIRGTWFIMEWLIDLDAPMVKFVPKLGNNIGIAHAGFAEEGFYGVFSTLSFVDPQGQSVDLLKFLKSTVDGNLGTKVDFVAHSLGGPISAMLACSVGYFEASLKDACAVTTFAAPAPGDSGFATFYGQFAPTTYRIWNGLDVVPSALALFGYSQVPEPGIGITPTWTQMGEYNFSSIVCNHSLQTYQWLLDSSWPLASGCGPWFASAAAFAVSTEPQNMEASAQQQIEAVRRREEIKKTVAKAPVKP